MPLEEALRRLDSLNWDNVALGVSADVGYLVSPAEAREMARREITDLYRADSGLPYGACSHESYEGPQRDCPVHGEES